MTDKERHQSTKWEEEAVDSHRTPADDGTCPKGRKWRIQLIFSDDHPNAYQHNHHHHSVIRFISNERSDRFKRKQGETVTKIKKGSVQHSPADAHSQAADPESFLYQYSTNPYPRTTHTSVIAIRL